ncbi:acylneuraminate cytidylyltransferase family protein [Arsenicibacter rosenii]|uniref:Cytidylyltransferase n=1 Tax=Arsenicibacter rosenii TaxID=1750698 RepID=A0A1S2VJ72_9BACT|nr:hypothetical protein [Arsenicibacter rosenii]OIN58802.1 hypothetical protein BLX24_11235 [Arsenicibacter rosenii]
MKRTDIVALIIGRGNNTLKNKNILNVLSRPLLEWPAIAAKRSKYIGRYYISSDCESILEAGKKVGYENIKRPLWLAEPTSQSSDVVKHAYETISRKDEAKIIIVFHANVGTISTEMIDDCIEIHLRNPMSSAVIPSHYKNEYHPYRAKKINKDGELEPFIDLSNKKVSANRQDLEGCLFFDHSFWVLSVERGIKSKVGQPPWPVMGNSIIPYITEGCFDVHEYEDLLRTEKWIKEKGLDVIYKNEGY